MQLLDLVLARGITARRGLEQLLDRVLPQAMGAYEVHVVLLKQFVSALMNAKKQTKKKI